MNTHHVRISTSARASISPDGLVLMNIDAGLVFASNAIGARIWQLIEAQHTCDQVARQISDECGVALDRAHDDVDAFVRALIARGLVTADDPEVADAR